MTDIDEEIGQKEKELKELKLKKQLSLLKDLKIYTDAEKIQWFDELYNMMLDELKEYIDTEEEDEDNEHYTWEHCMEILGKKVWDIWNSIGK